MGFWGDLGDVVAAPFVGGAAVVGDALTGQHVGNAIGNGISSVTGLGGIGQNSFQATTPDITRQNFAQAIQQAQGGLNDTQTQQQTLAKALQAQSQGQGPNPALDQLKATTNRNIAQANGLIASQRGINPALAARQAAMNAGNMNQQSAADAATMSANQQLGAQKQLQDLYGTMGNEDLESQAIQQKAQAEQNSAINQGQLGAQGINAGVATANSRDSSQLLGGILGSAGIIGAAALMSRGGRVPGKAPVPGDSSKNDIVPAELSPGEIVIPRSHASPEKAKRFVESLQKSKNDEGTPGYGRVLQARKNHEARVNDLKKYLGAGKRAS